MAVQADRGFGQNAVHLQPPGLTVIGFANHRVHRQAVRAIPPEVHGDLAGDMLEQPIPIRVAIGVGADKRDLRPDLHRPQHIQHARLEGKAQILALYALLPVLLDIVWKGRQNQIVGPVVQVLAEGVGGLPDDQPPLFPDGPQTLLIRQVQILHIHDVRLQSLHLCLQHGHLPALHLAQPPVQRTGHPQTPSVLSRPLALKRIAVGDHLVRLVPQTSQMGRIKVGRPENLLHQDAPLVGIGKG